MNSNKHIDFSIKKDESVYYFSMKNTIGHSVLEGNPELNTTKKDKIIHGFGTKIINDIAKNIMEHSIIMKKTVTLSVALY